MGEQGNRPLVCIGINPSTAEPDNLDPTLKTVQKMASLKGFDGWLMLNLYSQRATNPKNLHEEPKKEWTRENLRQIRRFVGSLKSPTIWAAWGTLICKRNYLWTCLGDIAEEIKSMHPRWITIGRRSKHGHPHHPLYLSHVADMEPFDILSYMEMAGKSR